MCIFTKKASAFGGLCPPDPPLLRFCSWTPLGDFHPPDTQSSFMPPNNPVRSTPLVATSVVELTAGVYVGIPAVTWHAC